MQDGFFRSLFDFSFSTLITPRIVRVVYMILVGFSALFAVAYLLSSLAAGGPNAVVALILAPVLFLLYVIAARVYLELVIVIFKIGDDVRRIADQGLGGGRFGGPAPGPAGPGPGPMGPGPTGPAPGPRTFI